MSSVIPHVGAVCGRVLDGLCVDEFCGEKSTGFAGWRGGWGPLSCGFCMSVCVCRRWRCGRWVEPMVVFVLELARNLHQRRARLEDGMQKLGVDRKSTRLNASN